MGKETVKYVVGTDNVQLSARFGGLENPTDNRTLVPFNMRACFDHVGQGQP